MKRLWLIALCVLAFAAARSQSGTLSFGLTGGLIKGDIANASLLTNFEDKNGLQTGALLRYGLNDDFAVQAELLWERRNFSTNTSLMGLRPGEDFTKVCWRCYFRSRVAYQSDFLMVPLTGMYVRQNNSMGIQAEAGIFFALLLANTHEGFEELYLDAEDMKRISQPIMEPGLYRTVYSGLSSNLMNTYDAGFLLGIGLTYNMLPNTALMLNGRTQIGFAGIYENPNMPLVSYKSYLLRLGIMQTIGRQ
ncbi:MAG: outer membrane beta-barrel protein [Bacteroidetes bacterium]|nr:outer membrane beta-barrel protein [Bacteroidota bacterium]